MTLVEGIGTRRVKPRRLVLCVLALASTLASSGCSLLFVQAASPPAARDCTSSKLAPILDSVMAGYQVVRTAHAFNTDDEFYEAYGVTREADIAVGASLTALFVGSAVYGYLKTAECSHLREHFVDRTNELYRNDETPARHLGLHRIDRDCTAGWRQGLSSAVCFH